MSAPNPADFASTANWQAAYGTWLAGATLDARQAELLAELERSGGRTTPCAHGYTPFDTCPNCD